MSSVTCLITRYNLQTMQLLHTASINTGPDSSLHQGKCCFLSLLKLLDSLSPMGAAASTPPKPCAKVSLWVCGKVQAKCPTPALSLQPRIPGLALISFLRWPHTPLSHSAKKTSHDKSRKWKHKTGETWTWCSLQSRKPQLAKNMESIHYTHLASPTTSEHSIRCGKKVEKNEQRWGKPVILGSGACILPQSSSSTRCSLGTDLPGDSWASSWTLPLISEVALMSLNSCTVNSST